MIIMYLDDIHGLEFCLLLVVLSLILVLGGDGAEAETITVDDDGGADYYNIQDALNAANAGATVMVFQGTYQENIVISKSVTLQGNGSDFSKIDGGGNGNVILVDSDNVTISGFTLTNSKSGHNAGFFTINSSVTVLDCVSELNKGYQFVSKCCFSGSIANIAPDALCRTT